MKKFLIKIFVYSIFLFFIFNGIAFLSLYILENSNFYKPQFVKNGIKGSSFDYVVLGSSTGLTTLDTQYIDSISNTKGVNISIDDSSLNSHYLMFQHFLANNKKTKTLILAVTPWDLSTEDPVLNDNDYRFLPHIRDGYVFDYFDSLEHKPLKILTYSKYFPILGIGYFNAELFYPSLIAAYDPNRKNRFDAYGNYCYPSSSYIPSEDETKNVILDFKNPYFYKIKDICHNKGIALMVYISPIYNTNVIYEKNDYIVLNHSSLLQDSKFFYDNIHVNTKGRQICSTKFSESNFRRND